MAGLVERIKIIFDVDDAPGVKGFRSIRTEMANAEGVTGKLKAGFGGLTDMVKQNATALSVAGVAAFGAFAVKAGQAFRNTALDAGKFSDATGLAVEDASRWMEVAGDLGISAETVQGALQKMNKGIADGKPVFTELGDVVVKTKDGIVDANATFTNTVGAIAAIEDPAKRAKAATDAFGKGYGSMAELTKLSAEQLRAKLAEVSDQKVIDSGELEKAKTWRERWDQLKDTFEDVQLGVGELVTSLSPLFSTLASGAQKVIGLTTAVTDFLFSTRQSGASQAFFAGVGTGAMSAGDQVKAFVDMVEAVPDSMSNVSKAAGGWRLFAAGLTDLGDQTWKTDERFRFLKQTFADVAEQSPETASALLRSFDTLLSSSDPGAAAFQEWADSVGLTNERFDELIGLLPDAAGATTDAGAAASDAADDFDHVDRVVADFAETGRKYKQAIDDAERSTRNLDDRVKDLIGSLDQQDIVDDFATAMWNYRAQVDPSAQSTRDYVRDLADMITKLDGVPDETKARLITELQQGDIESVESYLSTWSKGVTVPVRFQGQGSVGFEKNARGTDMSPGGLTLVGEDGPEFVDMPRGAKVYPAHETRQMLMGAGAAGSTGSSGEGITMHTTVQIMGNVFGVDDLDARVQRAVDERDRRLMQTLAAGVRK